MSANRPHTVIGIFGNRHDADLGMARLLTVGLKHEKIGMLDPEDGRTVVSARVPSAERGTIAAAALLASRAVEVECSVADPLRLEVRQPAASAQAA